MCHRAELVECLYESLAEADKARVHVGKRVASVETTTGGAGAGSGAGAGGVVVTCEDGSRHEGSIALGADGVHSRLRGIMREAALRAGEREADVDAERPFPASYRTMWATLPRRWELTPGSHHVTHGEGASLQLLNASRRAWVFVYEKLEAPTTERVRYTEADVEAFAARHGDMKIAAGGLRLRDVIGGRRKAGMANLEEGVLRRWSWGGRMVLAGDACHKYTPNAGQGLNNGIQDVAALANQLHRVLRDEGPAPGDEALAAAFRRYQEVRADVTDAEFNFSASLTRLCAWPNWLYWFVDQWVLPFVPFLVDIQMNYLFGAGTAKGQCLEFLEGEEPFERELPATRQTCGSTRHPCRGAVAMENRRCGNGWGSQAGKSNNISPACRQRCRRRGLWMVSTLIDEGVLTTDFSPRGVGRKLSKLSKNGDFRQIRTDS